MSWRRRWVLAPITTGAWGRHGLAMRSTSPDDDTALAALLDRAYVGTIDHDPDADHVGELETWRRVDGADDEASAVAFDDELVGACLIGRELAAPFVYEIAVVEQLRGRGVARALLDQSLRVLAARPEPHLAAWVTGGNVASETLLSQAGFLPVTPPVEGTEALGYYRAASAVQVVHPDPDSALAVTLEPDGPTLWIVDSDGQENVVRIRNVEVRVRHIAVDSAQIPDLAARAMPLRHAAWLLSHRSKT